MMFATLAQAKSQIEMDHDADDALIERYLRTASAAVKAYLKSVSPYELERDEDYNPVTDSSGQPVYATDSSGERLIRYQVESATLLLVAYQYRLRDNNDGNEFEQGYLPKPVTALLYPLRDPALA